MPTTFKQNGDHAAMNARAVVSKLVGGATVEPVAADVALTLLRVFAGLTMLIAHGRGKLPPSEKFVAGVANLGFPAPTFFAWCAALAESGGALMVVAGLATRLGAGFVAFTMAVAAFGAHAADPFDKKERALLFGAIFLTFVVVGCGRYGVDAALRRRL
jgi:putative oxidoreductase